MVPLLHNCVFVFHFSITCLFPFSSFNCFSWTCYKLNFVILSSIIYYFLLIAAAREAVLFVVLEYSIRGIWYSLPRGITDNFELCACLKKQFIPQKKKKKTEMQIKNPVHSLLSLTRFSRNDLLSTESDSIPSLKSLTSVLQGSTVFVKSSDDKYLF